MSPSPLPNDPSLLAGGAGPSYDADMDRQLTILETRFDTILPTLATKHDVDMLRAEMRAEMERLRVELHKAIHHQLKWMIAMFITLVIGLFGMHYSMLNAMRLLSASALTNAPPAPAVSVPDSHRQQRQ
ncbi:hypothetical protein [Massilia sp. CF038]|uniref:hypothetical protein n=1 Tax=Massilia sp. CF038 TaxID=1881045 RepID=UPI0009149715|nr:hypothetical protein [Massilia sp. CF038]SHH14580.1 hypothetical protein SAMN05428948_3014 [Massilia sp. CF038]